jgi:hypothetical protein
MLSAVSVFAQSEERRRVFVGYSNLQAEGFSDKNDPDNILSPDFLDRRSTLHGVNAAVEFPIRNFGTSRSTGTTSRRILSTAATR